MKYFRLLTPYDSQDARLGVSLGLCVSVLSEWPFYFPSNLHHYYANFNASTTFKNQAMLQGIEPDDCFYIQNEADVRGKDRLDLTIDPPPDLALEIDITSRTHSNIYEALGVPELWRFEKGELQINILQPDGKYARRECSSIFPDLPLIENLPKYVQTSKSIGRNKTMKLFRQWVREFRM
ncbi:MAG: Uma2 family endonuclease [Symploca sp. SIO2C1]|nr:Uma2 family endonuclease [Symploca sp. SIO2C1]